MKKEIEIQPIFSYNKLYHYVDKQAKEEINYLYEGNYTMDKKIIEEKVNVVLETIGYNSGEVDVINVANSLGFTVGISALPNWDDGFILVDNVKEHIQKLIGLFTDKAIGVNAERDLQTKRFIIAHEIGHYKLHYNENDGALYARREDVKGKDAEENDADYFGACLLMPKKHFKEKYDGLKNKGLLEDEIVTLLQKYFNTPYESVKRRLVEIA